MLPVSWLPFFRCLPPFGGDCDSCLPVQCRFVGIFIGRIFLLQGGNASRFCLIQGANSVRFFCLALLSFFAPFFQSSTFLSLRFVGVVASEFFFRLRVVYCIDSDRFFMGNSIGFASRKFFWSSVCLTFVFSKFSRENFRERTSG